MRPPRSLAFLRPRSFTTLVLFLAVSSACGDDDGDTPGSVVVKPPASDAAITTLPPPPRQDAALGRAFDCPAQPTAYVLDFADPFTNAQGAIAKLTAAGFKVEPLPLDRSPYGLHGLILLGSFASESPVYKQYMKEHANQLFAFVDDGNVLIQMAQADQTEPIPPFLPSGFRARRSDVDIGPVYVNNPKNPLLAGVEVQDNFLAYRTSNTGWETFTSQAGFEVTLSQDSAGRNAALMEAAYGQGRIVLSSLWIDKDGVPDAARDKFTATFFANLLTHVRDVCNRTTVAISITPSDTGRNFTSGSFILVGLPDTQFYSLALPGIFNSQTTWIATQRRRLNIEFVLGLGDITNNNTPQEWERAADSLSVLDGVVSYSPVPGNHDLGPSGDGSTRDTLMNAYIPYDKIAQQPTFGGAFIPGRLENTYHLFTAGGRDFIVISLEWGPRDEVLAWANMIMDTYPDRQGIMHTHAYLNNNDWRYDIKDKEHPQDFNPHAYATPGVNDGEEMWQKLIRKHRFIMVLNGHVLGDGTGYRASKTDLGNTCHQMLSNYQFRDFGGEGFLRLIEFLPDNKTVKVFTYSTLYDVFLADADQTYSFELDVPPQHP